jgi:hypothetical protein
MMISGQLKNYPAQVCLMVRRQNVPESGAAAKALDALPGDIWFFSPLRNKYSKLKLNSEVLNESL